MNTMKSVQFLLALTIIQIYSFLVFSFSTSTTSSRTTSIIHLQQLSSSSTSSSLYAVSPFQTTKESSSSSSNKDEIKVLPFIVEELSQAKASKECSDIADLVIKVFFEEEAELKSSSRSKNGLTPWKVMQLAYLKNLQLGDVKGKKFLLSRNINNSMFAARQIIPCAPGEKVKKDERIDIQNINNNEKQTIYNADCLPKDDSEMMYKYGPLLGFVDVSEKTFGLASDTTKKVIQYNNANGESKDASKSENDESSPMKRRMLRPVLTNLSVKEEARRSGVGSALVDACEKVVMTSWSTTYNEMVLEVEGENDLAQRFYEKRGYVAVYADPSARRFDTSGIILRDVRTTKIAYRKELKSGSGLFGGGTGGGLFDLPFFAKVKSLVSN